MKKVSFLLIILLILAFALPISPTAAHAEDTDEEVERKLDDVVNDALNGIDLGEFENLLNEIVAYNDVSALSSVRKLVNDILYGENQVDLNYVLKLTGEAILGNATNLLPSMILILIIGFLYGILQGLNSGFSKADTQKIVYLACYGLILAVLVSLVAGCVKTAIKCFSLLETFGNASFPILITLIAALGGSASIAVYQPMILIFGNILLKLINFIIMPMFYITFVFGLVGNIGDNFKLDKFAKTVKSAANWILGISFSLFITFMTAQGITGAGFDNLASRGLKYALSSYVPIIGGYLKEGFDIILAGCIVVKNALGLSSIIILIILVIVPIIRILVISIGLKLTAAILEPISDKKFSSALYVAADSMGIMILAMICAALSALIMLMMIIYTCNFGVL